MMKRYISWGKIYCSQHWEKVVKGNKSSGSPSKKWQLSSPLMCERPSGMYGMSKSPSMNNITTCISREVCSTWIWTREVHHHLSQPLCSHITRQNNPKPIHLLDSNCNRINNSKCSPVSHPATIFCWILHHRERWSKRLTCLLLSKSKKLQQLL